MSMVSPECPLKRKLKREIKGLESGLNRIQGELARVESALNFWETDLQDSILGYYMRWTWLQGLRGAELWSTSPPGLTGNQVIDGVSIVGMFSGAVGAGEEAADKLADQEAAIYTAIDKINEFTEKRNALLREYGAKSCELAEKRKRLDEVEQQLAQMGWTLFTGL